MIRNTTSSFLMVLLVLIATGLAAGDDLEQHRFCDSCGMDRKAYGYSRMLIRYEDGAETAACSLHCAAKALSDPARAAKDGSCRRPRQPCPDRCGRGDLGPWRQ